MRLVLDTHVLFWWVNRTPDKLTERSVALPEHHKDPVDRIIIATALEHRAHLLSADQRFPDYQELAKCLVRV